MLEELKCYTDQRAEITVKQYSGAEIFLHEFSPPIFYTLYKDERRYHLKIKRTNITKDDTVSEYAVYRFMPHFSFEKILGLIRTEGDRFRTGPVADEFKRLGIERLYYLKELHSSAGSVPYARP